MGERERCAVITEILAGVFKKISGLGNLTPGFFRKILQGCRVFGVFGKIPQWCRISGVCGKIPLTAGELCDGYAF